MTLHSDDPPHGRRAAAWLVATSLCEAMGDALVRSLLPILAVTILGAGAGTIGLINSLGLAAFLFLAMPVGALGDRLSRPTLMMTISSLARAGVALIGLGWWVLGWTKGPAGIGILLALAFAISVADVAYTVGRGILVPRIVPPQHIRDLFGRVHTASQAGGVAAPLVLSGALLLVAAPFVWPVAAVFYLASALTQRAYHGLDAHRPAWSGRESTVHALRHGFRHLWSQPTLRRITAANMLHNAGGMSANTLLPVIALTTLGISPAAFAAVGAAGAVAGIGGAISASAITERLGLRVARNHA